MATEMVKHELVCPSTDEGSETSQELDFGLKIDAVFSLAAADGPDTSPEKQSFVKLKDNTVKEDKTIYEQITNEKEKQKYVDNVEVTPTKDIQMEEVNDEYIESSSSTAERQICSAVETEEARNGFQEEQGANVTLDEDNPIKRPIIFRPCYVVVQDVIEHRVMQQELDRLRTQEEKLKLKLAKQKEAEEIKAERQKALRGYNSTSFAPFIEDPEEILKKKGCKALKAVTNKDKSTKAKDKVSKNELLLPARRSSRLHMKESDLTVENDDKSKSDLSKESDNDKALDLNDSDASDCRPSRKRKVSALLSGNSFILDMRGMNTVWQENMEMEKRLEAEKKKRANQEFYYSVYRLGYGRQQMAKTRTKLHSKRREDMPFVSIKLDREQVLGLSGIKPKPQFSPNHPLPDMKNLPFYVKMDLKMEETPKGSFKIWRSPKSTGKIRDKKKKKSKSLRDKLPFKNVEKGETENQLTLQGHASLKRKLNVSSKHTTDKVTTEELGVADTDVSHERVPCSLVGRCRKPSSKYSSGFVTRFHRNWKTDVIKARKMKREAEENDSNDEMTDSASETQDIESRNVSPCKDVKSEPLDADVYGVKLPQTLQSGTNFSSANYTTTTTTPITMAGISQVNINNSAGVNLATTMSKGGMPVTGTPNNYPNGFMSTVAQLAKEQNTKKFLQLRIGDKIVLIATDGLKAIPKAFVMGPLNPTVPGSNSLQNMQTPSASTQPSKVPIPGVKIAPKLNPIPAVPSVVNASSTVLLNPLSTQQGVAPFQLPIVKEKVVMGSPPICQHPTISHQLTVPSNSSSVKPSAQTPVLQNILSTSSNLGFMSASSMLSTISSAAMTGHSTKMDNVPLKSLLNKTTESYGLLHSNNKPTTITNPSQISRGLLTASQLSTNIHQPLSHQYGTSVPDKKDGSSSDAAKELKIEDSKTNSFSESKKDASGNENVESTTAGEDMMCDKQDTLCGGSNDNKIEHTSAKISGRSPGDVKIVTESACVMASEKNLDRSDSTEDAEAVVKNKNEQKDEGNSPSDIVDSCKERKEESDDQDIASCPELINNLLERGDTQAEKANLTEEVQTKIDAKHTHIISTSSDLFVSSMSGVVQKINCDADNECDSQVTRKEDIKSDMVIDNDKVECPLAEGGTPSDIQGTEREDTDYSRVCEKDVDKGHVTERSADIEGDADESRISGKDYADASRVTEQPVVYESHVTEGDGVVVEQRNECDTTKSLNLNDDETKDKVLIKCELPDAENVTHVPANETVVEERIRKLREKLRAKQAELDSFRKNIHSRLDTDSEML